MSEDSFTTHEDFIIEEDKPSVLGAERSGPDRRSPVLGGFAAEGTITIGQLNLADNDDVSSMVEACEEAHEEAMAKLKEHYERLIEIEKHKANTIINDAVCTEAQRRMSLQRIIDYEQENTRGNRILIEKQKSEHLRLLSGIESIARELNLLAL